MNIYKKHEKSLASAGIEIRRRIEDESLIESFDNMIKNAQPLPNGITRTKIDWSEEFEYFECLDDDYIEREIKIQKLTRIKSIAGSLSFFKGLTLILLVMGLLIFLYQLILV